MYGFIDLSPSLPFPPSLPLVPPTSAGSPPPSTRRHLPPNTPTPAGLTTEWYVGESRIPPQSKDPEGAFGDADHGPLLPKIMELDILHKRQTDALLGELLSLP